MKAKSFAGLWRRDGWRYALPAASLSVAATVLAAAPLIAGFALGIVAWPMAAAVGLGLLASAGWQALKAGERAPLLDSYAPEKAPETLQAIADNLFRKAGLPYRPDVRILNTDLPHMRGLQRTICVMPFGLAAGQDKKTSVPILLGRQVGSQLNAEEMTAMLAHATARAMVRPHVAGPSYRLGRHIQNAVVAGSLLTANFPLLWLAAAAAVARRVLTAKARMGDELLADRNAIALYPNPNAFASASNKVRERVMDARRSEFSWWRQPTREIGETLYRNFIMRDRRQAALEDSVRDVRAFNKLYSFPNNGRDVLPPGLHAAWQAERTPYFWERVRLPDPQQPASGLPRPDLPNAASLRNEWNGSNGAPGISEGPDTDDGQPPAPGRKPDLQPV